MKKATLILFVLTLLFVCGCARNYRKNLYLPEVKNDKIYAVAGEQQEQQSQQTQGYTITVPKDNYRYEKDYDDGNLEEKWEYTKRDDVEIKVTTYENMDEMSAREAFLRDNNDYIFEDMTNYPLCGIESNGDVLWFNVYSSDSATYVVSWEFPKNTSMELQKELADISNTFALAK